MLRICGNADSINVQMVLWCGEQTGIDCQRIAAALHFGIVNTPGFRALKPIGLVPAIDDAGFVGWESNTIVRYVDVKQATGTLWPTDVQDRADAGRVPLFRAFTRTPEAQRDAGLSASRRNCMT